MCESDVVFCIWRIMVTLRLDEGCARSPSMEVVADLTMNYVVDGSVDCRLSYPVIVSLIPRTGARHHAADAP